MQQIETTDRWQEIRQIWVKRENQWLYALVGFGVGVLLAPFLLSQQDILSNLFPEAVGILFTVLVIDQLNERRSERERKEELILQLGSPDNALAVEAVRLLKYKGWLTDDSLKGSDLMGANLQGAFMRGVNLSKTDLYGANLQETELWKSNLTGAMLYRANLKKSDLLEAVFDKNTILPDGTMWDINVDISRFTDPDHPEFHQVNESYTPAYTRVNKQKTPPINR